MDCIFCKIISGEIPSDKVYEDDKILAFNDITPRAPVHVLIIPKQHIKSSLEINNNNSNLIAHIFETIPKISLDLGLKDGYKIINNCGINGGQEVDHIHFHLLGGQPVNIKFV